MYGEYGDDAGGGGEYDYDGNDGDYGGDGGGGAHSHLSMPRQYLLPSSGVWQRPDAVMYRKLRESGAQGLYT